MSEAFLADTVDTTWL